MRRAAILLGLLALAGCGGGDDKDAASGDCAASPRPRSVEVIENSGQEGGFDPKAIYESEAPGVVTVLSLFEAGGLDSLEQGGGGVGLRLRAQRRGRGRHQRARRHHRRGRRGLAREGGLRRVRRRQPGRGRDRRRRPERRHRAAQDRPEGPQAAPAPARRERERRGRRARGGDRLAVRREAVAVGRRDLGDRPLDRLADQLRHRRRVPDRRGDQPRQLRRPAGGRRGPRDRHQPADQVHLRRRRGRRLRGPGRRRQALDRQAARRGRGPLRLPRGLLGRALSRSSSTASSWTSSRAPGSRRSTPAVPPRRPACAAAAAR